MCRLLSAILEERSSRFKPPAPLKGGSDHLSTHSVEPLGNKQGVASKDSRYTTLENDVSVILDATLTEFALK
jgi:hypothetical protein